MQVIRPNSSSWGVLVQFVQGNMIHVVGYQLYKVEQDQDENIHASGSYFGLGSEIMQRGKVIVYTWWGEVSRVHFHHLCIVVRK